MKSLSYRVIRNYQGHFLITSGKNRQQKSIGHFEIKIHHDFLIFSAKHRLNLKKTEVTTTQQQNV